MNESQGGGDNDGNNGQGRKIYAMNSAPDRPPNLYDDPAKVFIGGPAYKIIIFLATIQSSSVLVFLRHRIGKRVMRGWIFQFLFLILMTAGFGHLNFVPFVGSPGVDGLMLFYALAMGLFAWYHYHAAIELTEAGIPERLQLHTRARGDSHLMVCMNDCPTIKIRLWHFYTWRFRPVQVLPLDEPTVQRMVEPILLMALGILVSIQGSGLGWWLCISALSLVVVETDYQNNAMETLDDHYDRRLESRTMRIIEESLSQKAKTPAKMNGIVTANIARVSEALLQLQQERTESSEQGT